MKVRYYLLVIIAILFLSACSSKIDNSLGLREIKPGFYVYLLGNDKPGVSSTFNNGIIVTDDGVVVIDAQRTTEGTHKVLDEIKKLTDKPIKYLIFTTPHKPFTGGNIIYNNIEKIAQEDCAKDFAELIKNAPYEEQKMRIPKTTFKDKYVLNIGGKEIQVIFLGRGHTRSDTAVYIPEDKIVYMGETLYYEEFPYISKGYSKDWLETLEKAEQLDAEIFIPGHGYLPKNLKDTKQGLKNHWQIIKDVRDAVKEQVDKGLTEEESLKAVELPQYKKYKGYVKAKNIAVKRIYKELTEGLD